MQDATTTDDRGVNTNEPPPVVAVGASAGGVNELKRLFGAMPEDTGAAFVVLLHLDPRRTSGLDEVLSRVTNLAVRTIEHGQAPEPDTIHILPAGYRLEFENGRLTLSAEHSHAALSGVIDRFFRSLAQEQRQNACAIVLSGSGSDGALGAKAIKAYEGLVLAQSVDYAEYAGMPGAVMETVRVDSAGDTPDLIEPLCNHLRCRSAPNTGSRAADAGGLVDDDHLARILERLSEARPRHDFSGYKPNMLRRRIQRRMGLRGVERVADYEKRLAEDETECRQLAQDFLISVTDFFRDPTVYEKLKQEVFLPWVAQADADATLRIWVPGCATGEEAYSIAICAWEAIEEGHKDCSFVVFASDIDARALEYARRARYPASIDADLSPGRLQRFFERRDHHYVVRSHLRERVVFAPQNVLTDPPYSNLDLISCRNLLMYLRTSRQSLVLRTFHFALNSGGVLLLGGSETIGEHDDLFKPMFKEQRLFRRLGQSRPRSDDLPFLPAAGRQNPAHAAAPVHDQASEDEDIEALTRDRLLREHVPATVVINRKREILCSYGPTRDYFTLPVGASSLALLEMVRSEYRSPLRAVTHRAFRDDTRCEANTTLADAPDTGLRIVAHPLGQPGSDNDLLLVTFEQATMTGPTASVPATDEQREQQLYDELEATRNELQNTIKALEDSNEDLKSSNEEILSMNEELKSTNEERETSKEELQSVNEELTTVNDELETKVRELKAANDDLSNLFSGTQLATLFLDQGMCIKRFTPRVRELLSVIESDVGRPLADITLKLDDEALYDDAAAVLRDLTPREREVPSRDERWYLRRVLPYRTQADNIEGVVITFTDITDIKRAVMASRESEIRLDLAMRTINGGIWDMDLSTAAGDDGPPDRVFLSAQLKRLLGYEEHQFPGSLQAWREHIEIEDDRFPSPDTLVAGDSHAGIEYPVRARDGRSRWFSSHGRVVADDQGKPLRWIGIDYDITDRKEGEQRLQRIQNQLQLLADAVPMHILYLDAQHIVRLVNTHCLRLLGMDAGDALNQPLERLVGEDAARGMHGYIERALAGQAITGDVVFRAANTEIQTRNDTASYIPHRLQDQILGCYIVVRDTETANSVSTFENQQRLVYLQRIATVGEMTTSLAHDLKQPLSSISVYASAVQRLLHGNGDTDKATESLRKILGQVKHANEIVNNTRSFIGQPDERDAEVDLNTSVRQVLALTDSTARDLNINIRLELDNLPRITCVSVQIEQVLVNLLLNACDALRECAYDERLLMISTSVPDHREIEIEVADNGRGIRNEMIGRIFDTFYTSKLDGMGMGLALSRTIVENHGGRLWAESVPGEGATFYLRLPLQPTDNAADSE